MIWDETGNKIITIVNITGVAQTIVKFNNTNQQKLGLYFFLKYKANILN